MPLQGIIDTARSLAYWERLQDVTSNNAANANTDAFKADRLAAHVLPGRTSPVPVQAIDLEPGALRDTGRPLDVGLEGKGFLVVRTAHGERLMRGGSLRLDARGVITDMSGNPVLGEQGPIVASGAKLEVHGDGTVVVDDAIAGRLRLETVDDTNTLLKEGMGRYVPAGATRKVADGDVVVRQGSVEDANMNPIQSLVDLVTIQRAYASNIEALHAMDSVLGAVTTEVGRVQ
jgi:flagellar basal body rod protein FlgG